MKKTNSEYDILFSICTEYLIPVGRYLASYQNPVLAPAKKVVKYQIANQIYLFYLFT